MLVNICDTVGIPKQGREGPCPLNNPWTRNNQIQTFKIWTLGPMIEVQNHYLNVNIIKMWIKTKILPSQDQC